MIAVFYISFTSAQSLDVTARLSPWLPPGWPAGAQGEVRLVVDAVEDSDLGLTFPIDDTGVVTYRLPERHDRGVSRTSFVREVLEVLVWEGYG